MVLTVTLNPLLENRYFFDSYDIFSTQRANNQIFTVGGKGLNVSRQLNFFDIKNQAITFLGGNNGKSLRSILTDEQINFSAVTSKSETREATLAIDKQNRMTTFIGPSSDITQKESDEMKDRLKKMINNSSIVVLSGSSPSIYTDDIFPYAIELAAKEDKVCILDSYGTHLPACIEKSPMIIHNNLNEISESLNFSIESENDKLTILDHLYSKGIKLAFLTDGPKEFYASKFNFKYKITIPQIDSIDPTGSGDSFVAGIAYGLEKSMVFEDFVKYATKVAIENAKKIETSSVQFKDIENALHKIEINPIGKKMKLIDDSPNY